MFHRNVWSFDWGLRGVRSWPNDKTLFLKPLKLAFQTKCFCPVWPHQKTLLDKHFCLQQILFVKQFLAMSPNDQTLLVKQILNVWPTMFDGWARHKASRMQTADEISINLICGSLDPQLTPAMVLGDAYLGHLMPWTIFWTIIWH